MAEASPLAGGTGDRGRRQKPGKVGVAGPEAERCRWVVVGLPSWGEKHEGRSNFIEEK